MYAFAGMSNIETLPKMPLHIGSECASIADLGDRVVLLAVETVHKLLQCNDSCT